ncbi:MAG: hypothetical protein L3J74_06530 [Bacteroidales bacterium]|nr:hypothetical protein [Bacteroidales bacterium]
MSGTKTINYKGVNIFYMDFSNAKNREEINKVMTESIHYIRNQPKNSVIALTNMTNMFFNNDIRNDFQEFLSGNKAYIKISSVFGMSGLARFLFNSLMKVTGRDVRSFETMGEAQEFLVKNL